MKISQTKLLKPLSVHEHTHQMQTYCERKQINVTVPLIKGKFWLTLVILLNFSSSIKLMLLVNITSLTIYILGSNGPTFRFVSLPGGLENIPYKELVGF